jgi:hypothetical protein
VRLFCDLLLGVLWRCADEGFAVLRTTCLVLCRACVSYIRSMWSLVSLVNVILALQCTVTAEHGDFASLELHVVVLDGLQPSPTRWRGACGGTRQGDRSVSLAWHYGGRRVGAMRTRGLLYVIYPTWPFSIDPQRTRSLHCAIDNLSH